MKSKRCPNGHYYDPDEHSSCPFWVADRMLRLKTGNKGPATDER